MHLERCRSDSGGSRLWIFLQESCNEVVTWDNDLRGASSFELRDAEMRSGEGKKLLTAKGAKTSRKDRKEKQSRDASFEL